MGVSHAFFICSDSCSPFCLQIEITNMKTQLLKLIAISLLSHFTLVAQDWNGIPVPAESGVEKEWQLQEAHSDDFNYVFNASAQHSDFGPSNKWYNFYHNQWDGPGTTYWKHNHVSVDGNDLVLKASRNTSTTKMGVEGINAGCITSNNRVLYPVYVEASVSVADISLASDVWLLSPDDTQEIDIIECYGGADNNNSFFAEFIHLSHHSFIREPFTDYQPRDFSSWWKTEGVNGWGEHCWNEGDREYVRIGVNWIGPKHFEYYIDGNLVRVLYDKAFATNINGQWSYTYPTMTNGVLDFENGYQKVITHAQGTTYSFETLQAANNASSVSVIDPYDFQNGNGFTKELDIIINVESQNWHVEAGRTPMDADLANDSQNTMKVDWIRVYKPVDVNQVVVTLEIDNESEILNSNHETDKDLVINYSLDVGTGNTVVGEGVRLLLREMAPGWEVVKDYSLVDPTAVGQSSGSFEIDFSLLGVKPIDELSSENWYFLYLTYTSSDGQTMDKGISPITIVDPLITGYNSSNVIDQLHVFPNPVKTSVQIKGEALLNGSTMFLMSATGRELFQQVIEGNSSQINLDTDYLDSGVYMLKIVSDQVYVSTIVKE